MFLWNLLIWFSHHWVHSPKVTDKKSFIICDSSLLHVKGRDLFITHDTFPFLKMCLFIDTRTCLTSDNWWFNPCLTCIVNVLVLPSLWVKSTKVILELMSDIKSIQVRSHWLKCFYFFVPFQVSFPCCTHSSFPLPFPPHCEQNTAIWVPATYQPWSHR